MNVLCLDLALKTGWCSLIDGVIESGVQDFTKRRGESNGMVFIRFNAWLNEITPAEVFKLGHSYTPPFDVIVYELAHYRGGAATELCVGLVTRAQEFATRIGAEYQGIHSATLKKFIIGSGKTSKEQMMEWFRVTVGRDPIDDNEADARALLVVAMKEYALK